MSVKAMAFVWDMKCPGTINDHEFKPSHKYVLLAYADHADHNGKNIWPAVGTIQKKTGQDIRTIQRLTKELVEMGVLIADGQGPRGTNRWTIPYDKGWQNDTPDKMTGGKSQKSLGDIPSGDIPSGDKLTPELKEPEPDHYISNNNIEDVWDGIKAKLKHNMKRAEYETWVNPSEAMGMEDKTLIVVVSNDHARNWLNENQKETIEYYLGYFVKFVTAYESELLGQPS